MKVAELLDEGWKSNAKVALAVGAVAGAMIAPAAIWPNVKIGDRYYSVGLGEPTPTAKEAEVELRGKKVKVKYDVIKHPGGWKQHPSSTYVYWKADK